MLFNCCECNRSISDKALFCPHCGYIYSETAIYSAIGETKHEKCVKDNKRKKRKHTRLPNGFGQISEIKGKKLRNPFRVMVSVGKDENGRMISKLLRPKAYFPTYNDAYQALIEYNRAACDTGSQTTMKMLFEWWSMEHKQTLKTENSKKAIDSLWAYCTEIADMYISQVRSKNLKKCIEGACTMVYGKERKASPVTKRRMKHLFDMMFDYAVENDLAQKNYARIFQLPPDIRELEEKQKTGHISFGDSEMERLKSNVGHIEGVDMLLIQSYSGWRPNEMLALEIKNVNIKEGYFVGGMKTKAGKDRKVPIHPFILPFVKARYDEAVQHGCPYLFPGEDKTHHMNYHSYDRIFHSVIKELGLDKRHRPHDCRVQFITMLKNAGADEYAIKHLAGHKISDITEKLYTKRSFEWLISELERIE